MKKISIPLALVMAVCAGCATPSRNPRADILGVWELTKALNLSPHDAGFVENIKLVFQPEGRLYKMGPDQQELSENKLYGYRLEGATLIRTRADAPAVSSPFTLAGDTLTITESNGTVVHFKKRSNDFTTIPAWKPRQVPFSVNYGR